MRSTMVERERERVEKWIGSRKGWKGITYSDLCVGEDGWLPQPIEECKSFGSCLFRDRLSFIHFHNNSTWQSIKRPPNVKAKLGWLGKGKRVLLTQLQPLFPQDFARFCRASNNTISNPALATFRIDRAVHAMLVQRQSNTVSVCSGN